MPTIKNTYAKTGTPSSKPRVKFNNTRTEFRCNKRLSTKKAHSQALTRYTDLQGDIEMAGQIPPQ